MDPTSLAPTYPLIRPPPLPPYPSNPTHQTQTVKSLNPEQQQRLRNIVSRALGNLAPPLLHLPHISHTTSTPSILASTTVTTSSRSSALPLVNNDSSPEKDADVTSPQRKRQKQTHHPANEKKTRTLWTAEEDETLQKNSHLPPLQIAHLLKSRDRKQVRGRIAVLCKQTSLRKLTEEEANKHHSLFHKITLEVLKEHPEWEHHITAKAYPEIKERFKDSTNGYPCPFTAGDARAYYKRNNIKDTASCDLFPASTDGASTEKKDNKKRTRTTQEDQTLEDNSDLNPQEIVDSSNCEHNSQQVGDRIKKQQRENFNKKLKLLRRITDRALKRQKQLKKEHARQLRKTAFQELQQEKKLKQENVRRFHEITLEVLGEHPEWERHITAKAYPEIKKRYENRYGLPCTFTPYSARVYYRKNKVKDTISQSLSPRPTNEASLQLSGVDAEVEAAAAELTALEAARLFPHFNGPSPVDETSSREKNVDVKPPPQKRQKRTNHPENSEKQRNFFNNLVEKHLKQTGSKTNNPTPSPAPPQTDSDTPFDPFDLRAFTPNPFDNLLAPLTPLYPLDHNVTWFDPDAQENPFLGATTADPNPVPPYLMSPGSYYSDTQ